jgi:site-specific recombinase XerD
MKGSKCPIRRAKAGKKRWLLDLRYIGGRREFYRTEDDAKAARESKMAEADKHGTQALALTHEERVDFLRARDQLARYGITITQAVQIVKEHRTAPEAITFGDAITRFLAIKEGAKKDSEYRRILKLNLESLRTATGDIPLPHITRDKIEQWLFGNGWAKGTLRNKRIDIRTFFRHALGAGWIGANPAANLEQIEREESPVGIFKPHEAAALLQAAREHRPTFLPYITLATLCGIRASEVVALDSGRLHIGRGFVEVPALTSDRTREVAKSRKRRIVELSENAREWLAGHEKHLKQMPERWYHNQLITLRRHAARELAERLKMEAAEFPWPRNAPRHSFASYHLAMHGSADKTVTQMGHGSDDTLFEHYRELVTKEEAAQFWSILPA